MTQHDNNQLTQFANRYIAIWNEADAELRRKLIPTLWAEDGVQFISEREYRGYQALEERVTEAHEEFVKKEGFVFRLASDIEAHHNAAKLVWEMVPAAGGEVAATGTIFFLLNNDGRIRLDYHF